jgi:hypothetical protein
LFAELNLLLRYIIECLIPVATKNQHKYINGFANEYSAVEIIEIKNIHITIITGE